LGKIEIGLFLLFTTGMNSDLITVISDRSDIKYTEWISRILGSRIYPGSPGNQSANKTPFFLRVSGNRIQLEFPEGRCKPFMPVIAPGLPARGIDPLLRAIGTKQGKVIDMTAGWCVDASRIAFSGCSIVAFENSPLVYVLTQNAIEHCRLPLIKQRLVLRHEDSIQALQSGTMDADVIYMDPMFPAHKRNAASPKAISLLRELVNRPDHTQSFEKMFELAMSSGARRVVIKRPHHFPAIQKGKVGEIKSKQVRYDIYFPGSSIAY